MSKRDDTLGQKAALVDESVHVSLWGFRRCLWASPEAVAEVLELLPRHLLSGLIHIRYLDTPLVPSTTTWVTAPRTSRLSGIYSQEDRSILVQGVRDRDNLFHVLFHELGHHIYFSVLDSVEKKAWVLDTWGCEDAVSAYGRRNAAEDFAELFALYLLGTSILTDRPIKLNFMRRVVLRDKTLPLNALRAIVSESPEVE